mgnify:CR=1 FL=1
MTIVRVFLYHKIGQDNQENDDPQAVAQDNCQPGKVKNPVSQRGLGWGVQHKLLK